MPTETELPVEERIFQVLQHLGVEKAHFAGLTAGDWGGIAVNHPDCIASLSLVNPIGMTAEILTPLASRLLVFSGDRGSGARAVQRSVESLADAKVVFFEDYDTPLFADVVADNSEEICSTMLGFLDEIAGVHDLSGYNSGDTGEIAGINYRIQGTGSPLVLLPLGLSRSQWEPIIPSLAENHSVIRLGGAHLGSIRDLERRARTGFKPMVRNLMEDLQIKDGETVLDVGSGPGGQARELASRTAGKNPITAVDYSPYMISEAKSIARVDGLEATIEFKEGNAETLPFPDGSFDVVYSVTVMEEVDADRMLSEMVRVARPGGRIGVIVRANDSPWVVNLPISDDTKRKIEQPGTMGGGVSPCGCADRSLYDRFLTTSLDSLKFSAQLATFSQGPTQRWEAQVLGALSNDEAEEWRRASARSKADGTFFISQPFHCASGTKTG
jgi:SAM-dependent methyltransferase